MRLAMLCVTVLALAGCATAFTAVVLSDEDREMWERGQLHQPQCTMDEEGVDVCE